MNKYDLIIIGGGPAGLFAGANINKNCKTLILEKNESAGKKLLMSGAGRCNITHSGDIKDFLTHFGQNSSFLKHSFFQFSNTDIIRFLAKYGVDTITDKNGKVFPSSESSKHVLNILLHACITNGAEIKYGDGVADISFDGILFKVATKSRVYFSEKLIVSTGGKSYPTSGSSGDGYTFAKKLGHTVVPTKPALTPVYISDYKFADISGVSLQNIPLTLYRENKKIACHTGDIGFTHIGLSGPGILDFSRYILPGDTLKLNFINNTLENFVSDFIKITESNGSMNVKKYLKQYFLPESLIMLILEAAGIGSSLHMASVGKTARTALGKLLCEYPFIVDESGDFTVAMATSGGVSLKEVSSKSMESKLVSGLYFIGEVLDIDGDTGGYNLQAAFSTAFTAASSINSKFKSI